MCVNTQCGRVNGRASLFDDLALLWQTWLQLELDKLIVFTWPAKADVTSVMLQAYQFPDIFQAAKSILASKGWRGMYAGFGPTLLRDVPEIAIQFTLYSQLQAAAAAHQQRNGCSSSSGAPPAPWQHLLLGGVSGAVASTITMPLDVVKSTLQCATTRRSAVQVRQPAAERLHPFWV